MNSNYTVIRCSGRPEYYAGKDYYTVLDLIYTEYMSAGSQWDRPNMLLLDGKIVVESKLADIAWDWGVFRRDAYNEANRASRDKFKPDWLEKTI